MADYLRFILPSLLGIFIFMVPLLYKGEITIPVALMAKGVEGLLIDVLPMLTTILTLIVALVSTWVTMAKPNAILKNEFMKGLFLVHPAWLIVRLLGFTLAIVTLLELGTGLHPFLADHQLTAWLLGWETGLYYYTLPVIVVIAHLIF